MYYNLWGDTLGVILRRLFVYDNCSVCFKDHYLLYATLEVLSTIRGLRRSSEQIVIFMFIQPGKYSLIVSGLLAINNKIWGEIWDRDSDRRRNATSQYNKDPETRDYTWLGNQIFTKLSFDLSNFATGWEQLLGTCFTADDKVKIGWDYEKSLDALIVILCSLSFWFLLVWYYIETT